MNICDGHHRDHFSHLIMRTELADTDVGLCNRIKTLGKCQRSSEMPMRYTRSFLRPACSEQIPVVHLVIIRTLFCLLMFIFILWDLIAYPMYMKGSRYSEHDGDYVHWILRPSSWSAINVFLLEAQLIYVATKIYDVPYDNKNPAREPACTHPQTYLRIWNQFIIARDTTMLIFIVYMHSVQFNAHKDPAEESAVIMAWITMVFEQLYGAIPAHYRDMLLSLSVVTLVIIYLTIMSLNGTSIYVAFNVVADSGQVLRMAIVMITISFAISATLITVNKVKNYLLNVKSYTATVREETFGLTLSATMSTPPVV